MTVRYHTVTEQECGQRIDNFLLKQFKGVPKSVIYRIIRKGEVRVDKKRIKPEFKLDLGQSVRIPPVQLPSERPQVEASEGVLATIEQAVLFEDDHIIVLNKPAGLPVHSGTGVNVGVIEAFRQLRPNLPFVELAHRLDRGTSGILLLAKSRATLTALHDLFRNGGMEKQYACLVLGQWLGGEQEVNLRLSKMHKGYQVQVDPDGRESITLFTPKRQYQDCALLNAQIDTGRMHQIRVQLAHIGHPILGDNRYGDHQENRRFEKLGLNRLFLHAAKLEFMLDLNGQRYRFQAPLPKALQRVLSALN